MERIPELNSNGTIAAPKQLAREIVAMVNLNGGMVLLGVEDDGVISGVQRKNLEEWVMDTVVARKIHPLILPFYEEIQIDDQKRVAVISFTQGVAKPYVLRHGGREDIYIRIGSTSRLAAREQQAQLDEILDGPMVGRWKKTGDDVRRLISPGVIEDCLRILRPFISEETGVIEDQLRRDRIWRYPVEALRELIVNALAHRDWTGSIDIEVTVYSDRLEVITPGALQNSMTVEKMIAGQRSLRNPLIVEVLRDYGYVDARGMGIRTKVIPLMRRENGTEPVFEATDDFLKTSLYRAKSES